MYIDKTHLEALQVDNGDSQDPGYAPLSPETPYWGPPSGTTSDNDPGYAPISPETPSWGPPSGTNSSDPGFAPISPETPSWGPPSGTTGNGSSGNGSNNSVCCPGTGSFPVITFPGQSGSSSNQSNIRFLYAATGQMAVNIRLGNRTVINRLQYGNSTPYYLEDSGYRTIRITNALTGLPLYQGVFNVSSGTAYTFAIINSGSGIGLMQIIDTPCYNNNAACVRAVNLSPNSGPIDVFLSGIGRVFQNVDTFGATSYQAIRQGSYRAFVSESLPCTSNSSIIFGGTYVECNNTRIAIMDSVNVNFMNGVTYTLYVIGRANQNPALQILALESDLVY